MLHDLLLVMKMNFFGESCDNLNLSALVFRDNPSAVFRDNPSLLSGVFRDNRLVSFMTIRFVPSGVFRDNSSGVFHDNPSIPSSVFHEILLLSSMTIFYELF